MSEICNKIGTPDCPLQIAGMRGNAMPCSEVQTEIILQGTEQGVLDKLPGDSFVTKDAYMLAVLDNSSEAEIAAKRVCNAQRINKGSLASSILKKAGVDIVGVDLDGRTVSPLELARQFVTSRSLGASPTNELLELGIRVLPKAPKSKV